MMLTMPTDEEVVAAFEAIEKARENYRTLLKAALTEDEQDGTTGRQARLSRLLNRTREMLRRDAMTDEQREQLRLVELERKRAAKTKKTGSGASSDE